MRLSRSPRSWTWGSQAALKSVVCALGEDGGHEEFSVAVTLASSSRMSRAVQRAAAEGVVTAALDGDAQRAQAVEVRVQPPPADHIAAGRKKDGPAVAGGQGAGQQDGGADAAAEVGIEAPLRTFRRTA